MLQTRRNHVRYARPRSNERSGITMGTGVGVCRTNLFCDAGCWGWTYFVTGDEVVLCPHWGRRRFRLASAGEL